MGLAPVSVQNSIQIKRRNRKYCKKLSKSNLFGPRLAAMTNWSWSLQQGLDPQNEARSLFSIDFYSVFNDGPGTISVQNPIQIQRHNRKYSKKQAKSNLSGPRLDAMTNCSWSLQQGLDPQNEAKSLFSIDFYSVLRAGHESHFWRKSCHQKPPVAKPLIFIPFLDYLIF